MSENLVIYMLCAGQVGHWVWHYADWRLRGVEYESTFLLGDDLQHEADTGAPAGMVAVYAEVGARHIVARHSGHWSTCTDCHRSLNVRLTED